MTHAKMKLSIVRLDHSINDIKVASIYHDVDVESLANKVFDHRCAVAGLPEFFRHDSKDFPSQPFLKADEEKALYWYGKAADQGHVEAIAIFPEKYEQEIPEEEARYYRNQYCPYRIEQNLCRGGLVFFACR